ncbi:MAG: hypothetical protein C3F02_00595 [Parcubacteria group bacterium]|nr:MAG: hypothetical protein C3F02_00595 [Parcubacteria group bacterium]
MNDYQPLTPKELERGYFFLSHKETFRRAGLVLFAVVIVVIYGLVVFNLIKLLQSPGFNQLARSLNQSSFDWSAYHKKMAPQEIVLSAPQFVSLGNRRYDLVAFVNNPNPDWAVPEFSYKFVANGQELPEEKSFLNPGEDRVVIHTAYSPSETLGDLKVVLGDVRWRHYDNDAPVIDWELNNIIYVPVTRETVDKKSFVVSPRVSWEAKNISLYDFWNVSWQVVILSGDKVVGVKEYQTPNFNSLQSRSMEVVWLGDLPRVSKALVYPALNCLDKSNFKTAGQ